MFEAGKRLALTLALIGVLALSAWLGIRTLGQSNRIDDAERRLARVIARIELDDFARVREAVRGLSEHPDIVQHIQRGGPASPTVQAVLLQARLSALAGIVYVIDADGVVQSCSTLAGDALVGQSYAFRPYFRAAMQGHFDVYGAVGVTTKRRGFYFSAPVKVHDRSIGVVVAKLELYAVERALSALAEPVMLEIDDHVVFATNRPEWLYRTTRQLRSDERERIRQSRQFYEQTLDPLPFVMTDATVERNGQAFSRIVVPFDTAPGFSLVMLDRVRPYPLTWPQQRFVIGAGVMVSILGILVVALVVANHRRDVAKDRLIETEEHLARTLDGLADAVITTDPEGRVTRMNPAAARLSGVPPDRAAGRPLDDVLGRAARSEASVSWRKLSSSPFGESTLTSCTGEVRRVVERMATLRGHDDSPIGFVHVFHDTTEEGRLRDQLQQAQKMEAVGRLAGGVAHDFNNLLTAITGNAELAKIKLGEHRVSPFLNEIIQAATRASELTRQLLTFSRKTALVRVPVDVHAIIVETLSLIRSGLDPKIGIVTELAATRAILVGDKTQLQSALLNLLINARDAMPNGGTLRITSRNRDQVPSAGHTGSVQAGLELVIEDDGVGIPESVLGRIFEPFFTTKPEGRGTGLGLSAVYACVQGHGGNIQVESAEGRGAQFSLWLPISDAVPVVESQALVRASTTGGHLIVADDDAAVRSFAEDALRLLGYEVTVCGSGNELLACCERLGSAVSACIVDLGVPGPSVQSLLSRLRAMQPALPVLLVSGNVDEPLDAWLAWPRLSFLAKPYRLTELGDALDRLIAKTELDPEPLGRVDGIPR